MNCTSTISNTVTGLAPCRFPPFSRPAKDAAAACRPIASARVAVEQTETLLELSTTDSDKLGAVLRTAWALLLRCYTGQDDVSFGFQCDGNDSGEPVIARFLLDDSATVAETVGRAKTALTGHLPVATEHVRSRDRPLFDTAVVMWGFTKTTMQCHVLAPVFRSFSFHLHTLTLPFFLPITNMSYSSNTSSASWPSAARPA
jgi:hypothetical protein